MAAVTVSGHNLSRLEDMESSPTISDIGAGAGGGTETVTYLQGAQSVSRKVTNTALRGTGVTLGTGRHTPDVWLVKVYLSDYLDVNANGLILRVVGNGGDYNQWLLADDGTYGDREYPILGGWYVLPVHTSQRGGVDITTETNAPDVERYETVPGGGNGPADDWQVAAGLATGVAKSENIFIDAIDVVATEGGLRLSGGTGSDEPAVFADFVSFDEGTGSNRYGVVVTKEGIVFVNACIWLGDDINDVEFEDSNQTLVWGGGVLGQDEYATDDGKDFNTLYFAPTADSNIVLRSVSFVAKGRVPISIPFSSSAASSGTEELITASGVDYRTGDPVYYDSDGSTNPVTGLTNQRMYFAQRTNDQRFTLHPYRDDAYAGTNTINITAPAGVPTYPAKLKMGFDNRARFEVKTSTGAILVDGCSFNNFGKSIANTNLEITSSTFNSCDEIDLVTNGVDSIDACVFDPVTLDYETCQLRTDDPSKISNSTFIAGDYGGAIEITASGTYTMNGNTFTGYGPNGHPFDPGLTNVSTDTFTVSGHSFSSAEPIFYERHGNTTGRPLGISAPDGSCWHVILDTVDTMKVARDLHSALVNGRHTTTGNVADDPHWFYSARSAIWNTSGGHVTLDIVGGNEPSVYNSGTSTTTVNISVPIEITNLTEGSYAVMIGDGGAEDGNILLEGYADSTGKVTGTFSGTTPQVVSVRARNGGIIAAALQDDGTVFTDYTLDARNRTSPGDGTTNDVGLLPATPAVDDAFYFGGLNIFEQLLIHVTTAGATYVLTWEYWNGSTWSSLTVTDGTNSFQTTGWNTVDFTDPGDWDTTSVDSNGPYYYIRARVTTGGGTGASAETMTLKKTIQYQPFTAPGTIQTSTGLTATAVWQEDTIND